jgi:hypothetical protein
MEASISLKILFSIRRDIEDKTIVLTVALCFLEAAVAFAANPNMGS